jgi:hypothetical protein
MTTPAKVLLIGNEQDHLESRAQVLQHFWTIAISTVDRSEIPVAAADLVVVCHTLPEPERSEWVLKVRQEWPTTLIVKMNGYDSGPHLGADATVDVGHGPGALVSTIYELLTERGLASREWPQTAHERLLSVH